MRIRGLLFWFSIFVLLEGCQKRDLEGVGSKKGFVLFVAQAERALYYLDPETNDIGLFCETGDVPNFISTLDKQGECQYTLINSGGFTGSPSLEFIDAFGNVIEEYPLPTYMNPMEGVWVGTRFYFTDFGKVFSKWVYVYESGKIVDSVKVGPRPVGIARQKDYLFVACTGLDSLYRYKSGSLYRIDVQTRNVDSVLIDTGASIVLPYGDQTLYVLSTGGWDGKSTLYCVDPESMDIFKSIRLKVQAYTMTITDSLLFVGSWDGRLLKFELLTMEPVEEVDLGSPINHLAYDSERGVLWGTLGGYSGGKNEILKMVGDEITKITVSESDVGVGHLLSNGCLISR